MFNSSQFPHKKNKSEQHHSPEKTQTLLKDIDNLKRNLRSSLLISNAMINHRIRKRLLPQTLHTIKDEISHSVNNTLNCSILSANLLLEATSPMRRDVSLQEGTQMGRHTILQFMAMTRNLGNITLSVNPTLVKEELLNIGGEKSSLPPLHQNSNSQHRRNIKVLLDDARESELKNKETGGVIGRGDFKTFSQYIK